MEAQTLLKKADTAFVHKECFTAIELYQKALKKEVAKGAENPVYYKIASCYSAINNYKEAKTWIEKAIENGFAEPAAYLLFGDVLLKIGDYETAKSAYTQYLKLTGDKTVKHKIACCEFALSGVKPEIIYEVKNQEEINSPSSEYGLAKVKNKLIFSSSRVDGNGGKLDNYTGQGFSDIYEATLDPGNRKWSKPAKLKGGVNTKYNDGTFAFDKKTNTGYFMQCNGESGKKENCNIFSSLWKEKNNEWSKSEIFNFSDNVFSTGHPALTSDGNTLYFVSDMTGGLGGKDIWVIKRKEGIWGEPKNIGAPVNTPGNEVFPYIAGDSLLYFSSDGLIGFGGLDIFYSKIKSNSYGKPENMLTPINSSADDFSIVFNENTAMDGYFCSNRQGGKGEDDIYSFKRAPLILSAVGTIVESITGKPINKVKLYFKGSDGSVDSTLTDSEGEFNFVDLKPGLEYMVTAVKEGFFSDARDISTLGLKTSTEFSKKTGMDLNFKLIKIVYTEINIPNIYYASNQAELKPESKKELNKMARTIKETPNIKIQINSHTDEIGADDYNMKLSEKRAQNVVDYLVSKGVEKERLSAMGYGESMPIKKNAQTEAEHQMNRRTTLKVIKK